MRIISHRAIREFGERHPAARDALDRWYGLVESTSWRTFAELRRTFAACDVVAVASGNRVLVFNIGGNKYRLIAAVHFNRQTVFILRVLTHREYDQDDWKREL